jgi:uncharacterized protein YjbI with pentapeptide repeats
MKPRKKPIIKVPLESFEGPLKFEEEVLRVEYKECNDLIIDGLSNQRVVFDNVIFNRCTIQNNQLDRCDFMDCIFHHCIFTNNHFDHSSFIRCEWHDSKLEGTHFVESLLEDILVKNSTARYLDIANSTIKRVEIDHCLCKESSWFTNQINGLSFDHTSLEKADFFETSLSGVDLSTSEISGMRIDFNHIKGASVNASQAVMLCELMGVFVK